MASKLKALGALLAASLLLVVSTLFTGTPLNAQVANQVVRPVDTAKALALPNHHPSWASPNNDLGMVPANSMLGQMTIVLSRPSAQELALDKLLSDQQNPAAADYHHWLTPTEMGERFGLSQQDIASISGWLQSQGLKVNWISPSRTSIGFNGAAGDVGRAFQTELHYYNVTGARRMSVSSDPMVPEALAPAIKAVRGLYAINDRPFHHAQAGRSGSPDLTLGPGSYILAPADFATIYDIPSSLTGSGVTNGIVGISRTDFADFDNFRSLTESTFANPTEIVPTAFGGIDPGPAYTAPPPASVSIDGQSEATLDVTRVGSIAPAGSILLVVATSDSGGIGADAEYLVDTQPVPAQIMSFSFGACESEAGPSGVAFWDELFQQAAGEGISVFVSSGDSGASGCDAPFSTPPVSPSPNSPNYICSSTYATCVGGTEFNDTSNPSLYWSSTNGPGFSSALSYIPEGAWNEPLNSSSLAPQVAASGGGVSTVIGTPGWQTGTGVPAARSGRYTPDISFSAAQHDGYFGCLAAGDGDCVNTAEGVPFLVFSGTSAAVQDMAGVTALLDQQLGGAQGNLNPALYQLAASTPAAFHDVTVSTSGVTSCDVNTPSMCNNSIPGPTGLSGGQAGFLIDTGYDEVTGLGSLDVQAFLNAFTTSPTALQFIPVTPCRVADTRTPDGPFGGPELAAGATREFDVPQSGCNIPSTAVAYSLNVTVVPNDALSYLTLWPSGEAQPNVSTLNSDGRIKANAAITPAGTSGGVSVFVTDATHVILDIDGYFLPAGTTSALAFYPVTPCRVADTRNATGSLGGPFIAGGASRSFPVQSSSCGLPSTAQAYSLNVTAVPHSTLDFLTSWPTGESQPNVSTLNASTGVITANAAIVPAGSSGDVSIFASDDADVILDVNGYFAAPASGGLSLYSTTPCRVLDTRAGSGAFTGVLQVGVEASACSPPSTAQGYVLNATVVPPGALTYLTLWPDGQSQPDVSTLNAGDGAVTSNMAIVPVSNGSIDAFSSNPTQLILDLSGYFAP